MVGKDSLVILGCHGNLTWWWSGKKNETRTNYNREKGNVMLVRLEKEVNERITLYLEGSEE